MNERLKNRRIELGYTQKQVADKIGIPESAYQRYECTKRLPNAVMACKIADALQTTVEKLYRDC